MFSELSSKERILRSIAGKMVDRVAWSPFLTYYWEHQPQNVRDKGQFAYMKEIGADPLLRGSVQCFTIRYGHVISDKKQMEILHVSVMKPRWER